MTEASAKKPPLGSTEVAGHYANNFQVWMGPEVTRIAFAEHVSEADNWHSAVVMTTTTAMRLAKVIADLAERRHQHVRAMS